MKKNLVQEGQRKKPPKKENKRKAQQQNAKKKQRKESSTQVKSHGQKQWQVASLQSRWFFLRWITADPSPWGNFTPPVKQ